MDDLDEALLDAWNRITPGIQNDRAESLRRVIRRVSSTLRRPIRPWSLCIRACDTRISDFNTIVEPRRAIEEHLPHEITVDSALIRRLCAPVYIPWPGLDWTDAADLLGRHPEAIRTWIARGLFRLHHDHPNMHNKRGKPVPVIWSPTLLDPNANDGAAPDPCWGTLWQHLHKKFASTEYEDLQLILHRVPITRPYPRRYPHPALPRLRGWRFLCPGCLQLLTPQQADFSLTNIGPAVPYEGAPSESPLPEGGGWGKGSRFTPDTPCSFEQDAHNGNAPQRLVTIRNRFYLHSPCGRQAARLFSPQPVWTIAQALGSDLSAPPAGTVAHAAPSAIAPASHPDHPSSHDSHASHASHHSHSSSPSLASGLSELPSPDPYSRAFACHHCWKLRYFSLTDRNGWNLFISHLTAGLLYGREVAKPKSLVIRRKRKYVPHVRPAPRREQVVELIAQGLTSRSIASRLGIGYAGVIAHIERLYKLHEVHSRAQLLTKLGRPLPVPKRRAQVTDALRQGLTYKQIASLLGLKYTAVYYHVRVLYRLHNARGRKELIAKLTSKETKLNKAG